MIIRSCPHCGTAAAALVDEFEHMPAYRIRCLKCGKSFVEDAYTMASR